MTSSPLPSLDFPEKMQCLFEPKQFKVLWGGRGAGRSWGCARALLMQGVSKPIRVLCARELQKSISESVHKLLSDQILNDPPYGLGLSKYYTIEQKKIYGSNGTEFFFEGIKNNVTAVKSIEGIDKCWVEEANKVTENSWNILMPTLFRRPGGELWLTFNPDLETDYTYQRFVINADPLTSFVVHMTWRDNPWFPEDLFQLMKQDKLRDPDVYLNVWGGMPIRHLKGTVYANELRAAEAEGRIINFIPYEASVPVDVFMDLGRADHTSMWFKQRVAMQNRVLKAYQNTSFDISHYIKVMKNSPYNIGTVYLPHDAKAKVLGTKLSIEEQLRANNFRTRVMPRMSIADGINATRLLFGSLWFDSRNCKDGLDALRKYRFKVVDGVFSREPLHDESSDFADALRTMALATKVNVRDKAGMVEALEAAKGAARDFLNAEESRLGKINRGFRKGGQEWMG